MEQTATVIAVKGGMALVRARRASACGDCAGQSACGTLGSWRQRTAEMWVFNQAGARVGDVVTVEAPEGALLRAAARLYGAPMAGFFVAGFLALALARRWGALHADAWAALAALGGMAATLGYMRIRHARARGGQRATKAAALDDARIVRVLDSARLPDATAPDSSMPDAAAGRR